jgi:hypothetical protein
MLGRDNHEGYAEHRVTSGGIDAERFVFIAICELEVCKCTLGATDPVFLLELDIREIIHLIKTEKELICIFGDAEIPNLLGFLNDIAVTDIAFTALRVFVGKNDLTVRAIVYECFFTEYESLIEHLAEDPLCPFIVIFVGGVDDTVPVKGKTDFFELRCKFFDVSVCQNTGMGVVFDGGVFGGKTESIKADREKDVIALHSFLSGNNFKTGIRLDMTNVHTCTAGIRELYERIEFRKCMVFLGFKCVFFVPNLLPSFFDGFEIIRHDTDSPSCI